MVVLLMEVLFLLILCAQALFYIFSSPKVLGLPEFGLLDRTVCSVFCMCVSGTGWLAVTNALTSELAFPSTSWTLMRIEIEKRRCGTPQKMRVSLKLCNFYKGCMFIFPISYTASPSPWDYYQSKERQKLIYWVYWRIPTNYSNTTPSHSLSAVHISHTTLGGSI